MPWGTLDIGSEFMFRQDGYQVGKIDDVNRPVVRVGGVDGFTRPETIFKVNIVWIV
jgi:hypothetical protein